MVTWCTFHRTQKTRYTVIRHYAASEISAQIAEMCLRGQVFGLKDPRGQNAVALAVKFLALASAIKSLVLTIKSLKTTLADSAAAKAPLTAAQYW